MDKNHDYKLNLKEWLLLNYTKSQDCKIEFFYNCDTDRNNFLSFKELCSCLKDVDHKCKFIRNSLNVKWKEDFIGKLEFSLNQLEKRDQIHLNKIILTNNKYIPICDINGYFVPLQCSQDVTCWCVDKLGIVLANTIRRINENPVECDKNVLD